MTAENVFQKKDWKIKTRTFPRTYSKKERGKYRKTKDKRSGKQI